MLAPALQSNLAVFDPGHGPGLALAQAVDVPVGHRDIARPVAFGMLGHSDPTMTLRYAHVSDREVEAAAERIGKVIERAMATGK